MFFFMRGMSLVEMLLGLAIAGFLSVVTLRGAESLRELFDDRLLLRQAELLHDVIRHESRLAYYRAESRTVRFHPGTRRVEIIRTPLPPKLVMLSAQIKVKEASFGSVRGRQNDLEIRPNGSFSPGSVTLQGVSRECRVVAALRGALRNECKK